jgi:hypothetical protein
MKRITAIMLSAILLFSLISPGAFAASSARDTSLEQTLASDLKALSLFKGVSDTDFALSNAPTRVEAVVILIRMLGKESTAVGEPWTQPFGDVAPWADKYIGYAYQQGLTKGVSDTEFGSGDASAATFLTLILRALGYSDTNGDFSFSDPYTLARSIGLLPEAVDTKSFLRADAVLVSYSALSVKMKGSSQTLAEKLIDDGVFTKAQYENYYDVSAISKAAAGSELTAEQVYAKCSPAVFYIEVYDKTGTITGTGSGFFIDSNGTAVTNYHVVKESSSAKITVSDTKKVYDVLGVYDYNPDYDWAILKIGGSGFSYLSIGSEDSVVGGAAVYAIGSPLGLQNTITAGLISNAARTEDGVSYIQTSTAISHGSSGGALINKFGKVIGITTGGYGDGQNLNLAIPVTYISGYNSALFESYAEFAVESNISFYPSIFNVEIKVGNSSTVYVYYSGEDTSVLAAESSDASVAAASPLSATTSTDNYKFTITGVKVGTATVSMTDGNRHSFEISVTVGKNDPDDVLKQYLKANGTYDSKYEDYYVGASLTDGSFSEDTFLDYTPGANYSLSISDYESGDTFIASTNVYIIKGSLAYFDFTYKDTSTGVITKGAGNFTKNLFGYDYKISFLSYTGDQTYREDFASICAQYMVTSIYGAQYMMARDSIPVSIGDLGFDALYFASNT